jgi:hypothetical protein
MLIPENDRAYGSIIARPQIVTGKMLRSDWLCALSFDLINASQQRRAKFPVRPRSPPSAQPRPRGLPLHCGLGPFSARTLAASPVDSLCFYLARRCCGQRSNGVKATLPVLRWRAMGKPELDVSIDYYSLLNVSHRADAEEIKKSYRKLGTIALFLHNTIANPLPCSLGLPSRQELGTRTSHGGKVPADPNRT